MHAGSDRPEFAPPPEPALLRAFALAVLAHLLLVIALTYGLHWKRESQDAAVEAELWSALPQQAAPKPEPVPPTPPTPPAPPPPPPQPTVKAPPKPEPPVKSEPDIALEREKQRKLQEQERRQEELERQRAERARAEAQKKREQELAKKHEEELARKKEQQQKELAEARKKEEERKARQQQQAALDEKKAQARREETIRRMQGMAGTGAPNSEGTAARSSGPSGSWAGKVQAKVRPNITFTDAISGNPTAEVEVRTSPDGTIVGKRLVRSSGVKSWDDAVLRALDKTEALPRDVDGRVPSPVVIEFKPHG